MKEAVFQFEKKQRLLWTKREGIKDAVTSLCPEPMDNKDKQEKGTKYNHLFTIHRWLTSSADTMLDSSVDFICIEDVHKAGNGLDFGPTQAFSSGQVWMWEFDHKESWVPKNWCFWTVVLEKTLESLLDSKEIQPLHPKGDQSWVFTGRTDAETETPIFWPPDANNWLIGKDPDPGKDCRLEEKGTTEDEMVGWSHLLDGHECE